MTKEYKINHISSIQNKGNCNNFGQIINIFNVLDSFNVKKKLFTIKLLVVFIITVNLLLFICTTINFQTHRTLLHIINGKIYEKINITI